MKRNEAGQWEARAPSGYLPCMICDLLVGGEVDELSDSDVDLAIQTQSLQFAGLALCGYCRRERAGLSNHFAPAYLCTTGANEEPSSTASLPNPEGYRKHFRGPRNAAHMSWLNLQPRQFIIHKGGYEILIGAGGIPRSIR